MTRLIERPEHDRADFTGTYLLSGVRNSGRSDIQILELTDHSATVDALYMPRENVPALQLWEQVSCSIRVDRNRDFRRFLKVEQLRSAKAPLWMTL